MSSGSSVYREFGSHRESLDGKRRQFADRVLDLQNDNEASLREEGNLWSKFAALHIAEPVQLPASVTRALDERKVRVEKSRAAAPEHQRLTEVAKKQAGIYQGKMDALQGEIDAQGAEIRAVYFADERVKPLAERHSVLESAQGEWERKYARAVAERDEKRVAYEADEHFTYLRSRKFGTSDYRGTFVFKAWDRRLAHKIGFEEANGNYERLLTIPDWIKGRSESMQPEINDLELKLDVLEREFFQVMDVKHSAMADLKLKRDAALKEADDQAQALARINQYLADAALAQDGDLKETIRQFTDILKKNGLDDLEALARKTSTPEDDEIARRIQRLHDEVHAREQEIDGLTRQMAAVERKISGLRKIENEIDSNNWNGSGHSFSGVNVDLLVTGFIQGAMNEALIIGQLESAHRRPPPPPVRTSSSSSSGGFSSGGGFGSSSRSSGGGFKSGGGFGGGGGSFKTGGGF
jgi:prefoldin subunit 5